MKAKSGAKWIALLLATAMLPASATFHLMNVVEVFAGTAAAPNAQYVVIQMYASGQQFVGGHEVAVFNAAGTTVASFTFPGDVTNGNGQAKILIATAQAEAFFGLTADLAMSPSLLAAGGKVCFAGTVDCVAWGAYSGSAAGVGTPFNAAGGLQSGRAALRRLDIAGSATALDPGDDTDNSANDFVFGLPAPRNNAGVLGTVPGATCGNRALEGLEQCDDGNLLSGDGCSSTCAVDTVTIRPRHNDVDADGKSDIIWYQSGSRTLAYWVMQGASVARSGGLAIDDVQVLASGDYNGDRFADVLTRSAGGSVRMWLGNGSSFAAATVATYPTGWEVLGSGDVDGDGKSDILWYHPISQVLAFWGMSGSTVARSGGQAMPDGYKVVAIGDYYGDGRADVLLRGPFGDLHMWNGDGTVFGGPHVSAYPTGWEVLGSGDVDADGKSDILWYHPLSQVLAYWGMSGATVVRSGGQAMPGGYKVVAIGDYYGDGRADVLLHGPYGDLHMWNGDGSVFGGPHVSAYPNGWQVVP